MAAKIKGILQHPDFVFWGSVALWGALVVFIIVFGAVMFNAKTSMAVGGWFGTTMNKTETLKFIAFGMGGILAAIGAVAINRRATAQVRNNELIEKGHVDERFKAAVINLGSDKSGVRVASFYQFYYLARGNPDTDFRKSIFEILCAYLRDMTSHKSYRQLNDTVRIAPTEEVQELLNVLFKSEDKTAFVGFPAKLWDIYLIGANLENSYLERAGISGANLQMAHISNANLQHVNLQRAKLRGSWFVWANLQHADLIWADLCESHLDDADLRHANLAFAKFEKAELYRAKLQHSNLISTNFAGAKLQHADFSNAELGDADFRGAHFDNTIFENALNLDSAKFDKGVKEIIIKNGRVPPLYDPCGGKYNPSSEEDL